MVVDYCERQNHIENKMRRFEIVLELDSIAQEILHAQHYKCVPLVMYVGRGGPGVDITKAHDLISCF